MGESSRSARLDGVARRTWRDELRMVVPVSLVGMVLGITSAMIVLPRPVVPLDLPLPPMVPAARVGALAEADGGALERSRTQPLRAEVRALGSAFLHWNEAARAGTPAGSSERERVVLELRNALGLVRRSAPDEATFQTELRTLRAVQTELFVREFPTWWGRGKVSDELGRLSGSFLELLVRNAWVGAKGQLRVPHEVLRARYKLHWTSIVWSLQDCEHAPPPVCYGFTTLPIELDEMRIFARFLLEHPVLGSGESPATAPSAGSTEAAFDPRSMAAARTRKRLSYLERFVALDEHLQAKQRPERLLAGYPIDMARAVLLYQLGQYQGAAAELRKSIVRAQTTPEGEGRDSRAINWLLATLERS